MTSRDQGENVRLRHHRAKGEQQTSETVSLALRVSDIIPLVCLVVDYPMGTSDRSLSFLMLWNLLSQLLCSSWTTWIFFISSSIQPSHQVQKPQPPLQGHPLCSLAFHSEEAEVTSASHLHQSPGQLKKAKLEVLPQPDGSAPGFFMRACTPGWLGLLRGSLLGVNIPPLAPTPTTSSPHHLPDSKWVDFLLLFLHIWIFFMLNSAVWTAKHVMLSGS